MSFKKSIVWMPLLALTVLLTGCAAPPLVQGSDTAANAAVPASTEDESDSAVPVTGSQLPTAAAAPTATDVHRKGLQNPHLDRPETPAASRAEAAQALSNTPATTEDSVSTEPAAATDGSASTATSTSQPPAPTIVLAAQLNPDQWKTWPEMPTLPRELKTIYQRGLAQGNDPHAFSILGDCQSKPDVFLGVYDSDPRLVSQLTPALQETVANFSGSFNRYSPTVKDGTTEGALLWAQWNDNKEKKCSRGETPIDCELRTHRPSIVFIHVGTHWEARNRQYLETILQKIEEHGAVPILVTKADNREKDERVNHNLASLAAEYDLPLWNFWATVQHLPDNGLKSGSDMYLNDEAVQIHRQGALRALDAVWRALQD